MILPFAIPRSLGEEGRGRAYVAALIRQMEGVSEGRRLLHPDPNVRLYRWKRGGKTFLSAWAIKGESSIALDLGQCQVTDAFGHERAMDLTAGLPLSDFPLYIRGVGLSPGYWKNDEKTRAARFYFAHHRAQFTVARGTLRQRLPMTTPSSDS